MSSEDPNKQKNAKKVLDLMEKGRHWVLVVRFSFAFTLTNTQPCAMHNRRQLRGGRALYHSDFNLWINTISPPTNIGS
ncbi:hypothetical protein DFH09DRAFT_1333544 [Mycena vulgaris]|nr:hypothetical protein DFH09DRAFT_1333544 [Mycena vulgaris]